MRVAFFANHNKTYFLRAVQRELESHGHEVHWIVPGNRLARMLLRSGVRQSRVLDLTRFSAGWTDGAPKEAWIPGELLPGEMQIYEMIGADRFLRERPTEVALAYLKACTTAIVDFVEDARIEAVLGEQTYALELLTAAVLARLPVPYLVPATVRIPSTRFALFAGSHQARFATDLAPGDADRQQAADFVARFAQRPERPYYFERHQGRIRPSRELAALPGEAGRTATPRSS